MIKCGVQKSKNGKKNGVKIEWSNPDSKETIKNKKEYKVLIAIKIWKDF